MRSAMIAQPPGGGGLSHDFHPGKGGAKRAALLVVHSAFGVTYSFIF